MATKKDVGEAAGSPTTDQILTQVGKLDRESFPDKSRSPSAFLPATLENFRHLFEASNVQVRFNAVKKRAEIEMPGLKVGRENRDAVILAQLESLVVRNEMSVGQVRSYLLALADANPYDPFAEWVDSKVWDGQTRVHAVCKTIRPVEGYSTSFRDVLITKWLLSIVAATFQKRGFRARGVLTLQGAQGLGKTSWIAKLVAPQELRDEVIKLGHSWDGGSKDAKLAAIRHRIVELGELEASFKREMAGLKAFITEENDKIRPPYGRVEAEYPRTTIFAASVNDPQFLLDATGNSRFWTIAVEGIDYEHDVDTQQLFAELKVRWQNGDQWWLTPEEERELETVNHRHRLLSAVEVKIEEALDLERIGKGNLPRLTASQVLQRLGYEKPTNPQSKEANQALRRLLGAPKRSGANYWRIPWRDEASPKDPYDPATDEY